MRMRFLLTFTFIKNTIKETKEKITCVALAPIKLYHFSSSLN